MATETTTLFDNAPPSVQAIVAQIAADTVPTQAQLADLPEDALNTSWGMPEPKDMPTFGHPLLREAVVWRNLPAASALITAGANIDFNDNEMPFLAGHMADRQQRRLWFPDYSDGIDFLELWLSNGGSPNVQSPWDGFSLLSDLPPNNLEAVLFMLANGADPWATYVTGVGLNGYEFRSRSFFEGLANANAVSVETSYRIAREGHYEGGSSAMVDALTERYERTAAQYNESSGPAALHRVWMLQKALPLIYEQIGHTPGVEVAKLLAVDVPDDIGGFWLAPGEIRSPDVEAQRPLNDNQIGQQRWDTP